MDDHSKNFTWKELSRLNSRENAHVAYEGKVYNVSSFVSKHPGGAEQILSGAGRDITQMFKCYHKRDTFERVLSKYYVGELVDNELPVFVNESDFHNTIKEKVESYMKQNKLDPKSDNRMFFTYFVLVFLYCLSLYLMVHFHEIRFCCIFFAVLWGLLTTVQSNTLFHDSCHFAITHRPWVWKAFSIVSTCINGLSMYIWRYQHVVGHHPYTNIEGADPDIDTGPKTSKGIWRIKATQPWTSQFLYQHIYIPFLYTMLGLKMRIQDFPTVFSLMKDDIRMNELSYSQWVEFWFTKAAHVVIRFVIPLMYMPLADLIIATIAFELACSLSFAQITQLNHVSNEVEWPRADEEKKIYADWAELQVAATLDYCTDSWFWTLFTGALNHQTAHHLFPGYNQSHYSWITPIIKQTCAEYGIKYNCVDSVVESLKSHYGFLKKMGQPQRAHPHAIDSTTDYDKIK